MDRKSIFTIKGTNIWILCTSIAGNLLFSFFVLIISFLLLGRGDEMASTVQIILLLCEFIVPFVIGWFSGWLAFDDRGPTYGIYGGMASALIVLITLLPNSLVSIMIAIAAIAGGFNGGFLSRYRPRGKK